MHYNAAVLCHAFIGVDYIDSIEDCVASIFSSKEHFGYLSIKRDKTELLQPPRNIFKIGARESFQNSFTLFSSSIKKMVCLVAKVGQHFSLMPEVLVQAQIKRKVFKCRFLV